MILKRKFDKVSNDNQFQREIVHTVKVRAGRKRTYFFDIQKARNGDFYVTLSETTRREDGRFKRQKIFLYKEDFNRFVKGLEEVVNMVKTELMPDYDYDLFDRRQEEWEAKQRELAAQEAAAEASESSEEASSEETSTEDSSEDTSDESKDEEISW